MVCGGDCKKYKILNIVPGMQGRLFLIFLNLSRFQISIERDTLLVRALATRVEESLLKVSTI